MIDTGLPADEDLPAQPPGWRPPSAPLESRSLMLLVSSDIELMLKEEEAGGGNRTRIISLEG